VREQLALRVLAEQPRIDLDARKAITAGGEAGDLLVRESAADRQAPGALALLEQPLEAAPVARRDLDNGGELVYEPLEILDPARLISRV